MIISATITHMLQNNLLDKNISTTVGPPVSTITGDNALTLEKTTNNKNNNINANHETNSTEDESTTSSSSPSPHQRRHSARNKAKLDRKQRVQFQTNQTDIDKIQQE